MFILQSVGTPYPGSNKTERDFNQLYQKIGLYVNNQRRAAFKI